MANLVVNALVGKQQMEIVTDNHQWESLTVNGQSVPRNANGGFTSKVNLSIGVAVPFIAVVSHVEILNSNVDFGVSGTNYDGYWLTIDYSYVQNNNAVQLSGTLEWKNGFIHDAKNEYPFSQGKLTGELVRVS